MKPAVEGAPAPPSPKRLAEIRPLQRADLPDFAALFELALGSGKREASPAIVDFFERTLLDHPWADPELSTLVAVDEGGVPVGFLGAEVRHMRFGDRRVRSVWTSHMVVEPAARRLGVGAFLLRRMLDGPQDLTLTRPGTATVRRMWQMLGGHVLHLHGIKWLRIFQPWRFVAALQAVRQRPRAATAFRPVAPGLDAVTTLCAARYLKPAAVDGHEIPLTPRALLDFWPTVTKAFTLYPDYDEPFLTWLFEELVRVQRRGQLVARMVHDSSARPLGSYVYYLRPGARSEVLQLTAPKRHRGLVFDHLLRHAFASGAASLEGYVSPELHESLLTRRCLLWNGAGALVHSRDPELLCAMRSDQALVTELEGDWYGSVLA